MAPFLKSIAIISGPALSDQSDPFRATIDNFIQIQSKSDRENPRNYNGPNPNSIRYRMGNVPWMSWMSNHFYIYGGDGFTSFEAKEYNFGSVKPGMLHNKT